MSLPQRFGASFYPFLFLCFACAIPLWLEKGKLIVAVVLILYISVNLFQQFADPNGPHFQRLFWAFSSDFINHLSNTNASAVFVLNDLSAGFASPELVSTFAGYRGKLTVLSNMELSRDFCEIPPIMKVDRISLDDFMLISNVLPSCATYLFNGADPLIHKSAESHPLQRNSASSHIVYELPKFLPLKPSGTPSFYGPLKIELTNAPADSIILTPELKK